MTPKTKKAKWTLEGQYGRSVEDTGDYWVKGGNSSPRVGVWRDGDDTPTVEVKARPKGLRPADRKKAWAEAVKRAEVIAAALNEAGL